jgi:mono/diheme cytochrome c family protein
MDVVSTKLLLSLFFLAAACVAFFTMLHVLGAPHTPRLRALRITHRISGGVAVILFIVLAIMCIVGPLRGKGITGARAAMHLTFAAIFIPLILMKILIVERYPELRSRLFGVGTMLFAVVFVLFFTSTLEHMAGGGGPYATAPEAGLSEAGSSEALSTENLALGKDLFVIKCAKCHRLDRALAARKTPGEWTRTVETMRQKDPTWMGESEAERVADFLISLGS